MQRSLEEPSTVREVLTLTLVDGTRMTVEVIDVQGKISHNVQPYRL